MMPPETTLGLYIHVPFCVRKCPYCDFYSVPQTEENIQQYTAALCRFLRQTETTLPVDTIYFGGGTPSLLPVAALEQILQTIAAQFSLQQPEITLECNPATVTKETLAAFRRLGINRLSIGVQSLSDLQLQRLGRLHNAAEAIAMVEQAAAVGLENLSCDVMLALPQQTKTELQTTLEQLTALPIQHISAYLLKVEDGTPYAKSHWVQQLPDEDATADFYLQTVETLRQHGFQQYEISNFAKKGYESRHNCKYWRCMPYLGFGAAAHSCYAGKRFYVPSDLQAFCQAETQPVVLEDAQPCTQEEQIMLGLRLLEGIPCTWLNAAQLQKMKRYETGGLVQFSGERVALTAKGCLVSNAILAEIL
jgi:oxygen-independent coproporphyrinogen-3 oxidase